MAVAPIPNAIHCSRCNKTTPHRPKMDAVKNGNLVCNVCDKENPFRQIFTDRK